MSYDFCILAQDGGIAKQVSFGLEEHHLVVEEARSRRSVLICRCADYYSDVEFSAAEVKSLKNELETLLLSKEVSNSLSTRLHELLDLCRVAIESKSGISAIAD